MRRGLLVLTLVLARASVAWGGNEYQELGRLERESVDSVLRARGLEVDPNPEGKLVRYRHIVNLEVFSERDTFLQWFNVFHATSRVHTVARYILLEPGQPWRQELADESLRNLRDPFLSNVVVLLPVKTGEPGTVDVLLVTRDVWSLRLNFNVEVQADAITLLSFSLSENNLAGRRKKLAFAFFMDQGAFNVGPVYTDPAIAGTRMTLVTSARAIFSRETREFEGTRSTTTFAYPLWSLDSKWGAGLSLSHYDARVRYFQGNGLLPYDVPETQAAEAIPTVYDLRTLGAAGSLVRSYGRRVVQRVGFGHELAVTRPSLSDDFPGDEAAAVAFERDVLPRSELASALYLEYGVFTPRFQTLRNLDTFDFREDYRLGPTFNARSAAATRALGSENEFLQLGASLAWGFDLWPRGYQRISAAWGGRYDGGDMIDNLFSANVYFATPQLGGLGRLLATTDLDVLVDETGNRFVALGGSNGLRGYPVNAFRGQARLVGHVEARSVPLELAFFRLGGVLFWDVGHAAESLSELSLRHDVGVGIRFLIPQFDPFVFRFDWAFASHGPTAGLPGRITFGAFQVF